MFVSEVGAGDIGEVVAREGEAVAFRVDSEELDDEVVLGREDDLLFGSEALLVAEKSRVFEEVARVARVDLLLVADDELDLVVESVAEVDVADAEGVGEVGSLEGGSVGHDLVAVEVLADEGFSEVGAEDLLDFRDADASTDEFDLVDGLAGNAG